MMRARRWPATINPYLFINWYTAVRECRVSHPWVSRDPRRFAAGVREDRILDEARAPAVTSDGPCDLFGLTVGVAERCTRSTSEPT